MEHNKAADRFLPFKRPLPVDAPLWRLLEPGEISSFIQAALEKGATNVTHDFAASAQDETARFLTVTILPLVRGTRVIGSIVKVDDTTEKYRREILARRMENLSSLTNLAASVAHEIKNPLAGISIHIQLIQKALKKARDTDGRIPEPKFAEAYLDVITEEIDRLNKIIVDFLFAVRPVQVDLSLHDGDDLVQKFADFVRPELEEAHIALHLDLASHSDSRSHKPVTIMLDEKLFRQILVNLVKNAKEALLTGATAAAGEFPAETSQVCSKAGTKDIALVSRVKHDRYFLSVTDNGPGMDAGTAARIFEPYFTTKNAGTGLGLTMVYKIVKEMLGDIDVKSSPNTGTRFVLSFPIPQGEKKRLTFREE
jgi:signal transduction histidine kinase